MEFIRLTKEQFHHFDENGYLVVPKAMDRDAVEEIVEIGDRFMEFELCRSHKDSKPINYYFNRHFDLTQNETLLQVVTNSNTIPLVVQLLSSDIRLSGGNLIYKYPQLVSSTPIYPDGDGRSFRNWHRDLNNFAPNHPIRNTVAIRVTYCLTDFSKPNSGITLLVAGSHRLINPLHFDKQNPQQPEADIYPDKVVELSLHPGDAYLFSTLIYHTPAVNFTNSVAKVLMANYAYRWWGEPVYQTTDEVFDKVDEIGTQLLGKRISGNLPLTEWAKKHGILSNEPQMRIYV